MSKISAKAQDPEEEFLEAQQFLSSNPITTTQTTAFMSQSDGSISGHTTTLPFVFDNKIFMDTSTIFSAFRGKSGAKKMPDMLRKIFIPPKIKIETERSTDPTTYKTLSIKKIAHTTPSTSFLEDEECENDHEVKLLFFELNF